jgi:Tfp pilus assembly protein PilW
MTAELIIFIGLGAIISIICLIGGLIVMAVYSLFTNWIKSRRTYPFIAQMSAKRKGARHA